MRLANISRKRRLLTYQIGNRYRRGIAWHSHSVYRPRFLSQPVLCAAWKASQVMLFLPRSGSS